MQSCSVVHFTMSISPNYLEAATNVAAAASAAPTSVPAISEVLPVGEWQADGVIIANALGPLERSVTKRSATKEGR
jgi:hypothetical protein